MNPLIYNISIAVGLTMIGIGTALFNVAASLIVTGTIIIGLTVYATTKR